MTSVNGFRAYCAALMAVAIASAVVLALVGPLPSWMPVLLLGGLFAFAENASVELPNRSGLSASLMLALASIVVFQDQAPYLGPMIVGSFGCLYVPHLRNREWAKISFNLADFALSTLAAATLFNAFPFNQKGSTGLEVLVSVPTALTYSTVNSVLLAGAVIILTGRPVRAVTREMWLGDLQILPFAVLGVLLGELYLDLGAWLVPLFVAPILIARAAFASYLALREAQEATLSTLIRTLEAKDRYTAGHVERVATYAELIAVELGFRHSQLVRLRYAALLHDIGKLVVPNQILNKPGRLTEAEFAQMRRHESASLDMLRRIDFLAPVAPSLEAGAAGDRSGPVEARIIGVADAFDAMTSTRAYRRALSQEVAFSELRGKAGTQFDSACVEALITVIERSGDRYGAGHEVEVADYAVPPPVAGLGSAGLGDLEPEQGVKQ
jgi:hypothetical protein